MTKLQQIRQIAQTAADRSSKAVLILNLNRFSPLYVVREFDEALLFSDRLVEVVEPRAAA